MTYKSRKIKIEKAESPSVKIDDMVIEIGEVEEDTWDEAMGPTPKPEWMDLRDWDHKLIERYEPFYSPTCDMCCLCSFGKCDLTHGKRGACGIDSKTQQARMIALECAIGTAAHGAHARHLLEHLIERLGGDYKIDLGMNVAVEAPIYRTIVGSKPETLGDLREGMDYSEKELQHILSSVHTGQEGSYVDFESKALHVGMIDNLVKEIADIAQIVGYDFPKGDPDAPLADIGYGSVDRKKPVVLFIGHNVAPGAEVITYAEVNDKIDKIEVAGLCCTAHDLQRRRDSAKIIGPMSDQIKFIRSGIADVIVVDEQCVRVDILEEAQKVETPVIASNDKMGLNLPDRTLDNPDEIVDDLATGKAPGVLIWKPEKVGEVAVKLAERIAPIRAKYKKGSLPSEDEVKNEAARCVSCEKCQRACPVNLHISPTLREAAQGNFAPLAKLRKKCIGCIRCESACQRDIKVLSLIEKAAEAKTYSEIYKIRIGRGPILDTEIRNVGAPIVFGEIPGLVAFAGCSNYANGAEEVARMAEEFLKRNYIVVVSGCAAMSIAEYKDENGQTLYERYPGTFDAGGLVNVGSCVANAHIIGAAIKIPAIFARRNLRGNFEEISDYIFNRVGAVGVVWGAMSQKAISIGTGLNRWGIPVVMGPTGTKYRRLYLGRKDKPEKWKLYDAKTGEKVDGEPAPEHLAYAAESMEEAMVMIAKLVMRPNDTTRQIKLAHYIDLHQRYMGTFPDDVHLFVRTEADIPINAKKKILEIIRKKGWKPRKIPDPTLLERMIMKRKEAGK